MDEAKRGAAGGAAGAAASSSNTRIQADFATTRRGERIMYPRVMHERGVAGAPLGVRAASDAVILPDDDDDDDIITATKSLSTNESSSALGEYSRIDQEIAAKRRAERGQFGSLSELDTPSMVQALGRGYMTACSDFGRPPHAGVLHVINALNTDRYKIYISVFFHVVVPFLIDCDRYI
jgi:hypothetical protein